MSPDLHRATALELSWARTIIETLFPGCGGIDLEQFVSQTFETVPATSAAGLRAAIAFATVAPFVVLHRPVLLDRLTPPERFEVLERMGRSDAYPMRGAYLLLKAIAARACASAATRGSR